MPDMPGIPPRDMGWEMGSCQTRLVRIPGNASQGRPDLNALILDTKDARVITFWEDARLEHLARTLLDHLNVPQLIVADLDDLRRETGAG